MESENNKTKKCQFCAEDINIAAIKCKHCGSMLNGDQIQPSVSNVNQLSGVVIQNKGTDSKFTISKSIKVEDLKCKLEKFLKTPSLKGIQLYPPNTIVITDGWLKYKVIIKNLNEETQVNIKNPGWDFSNFSCLLSLIASLIFFAIPMIMYSLILIPQVNRTKAEIRRIMTTE